MVDVFLLKFETYEDYVTSFISDKDRRYLGHENTCQEIISLGYRTLHLLTEEEFENNKQKILYHFYPRKIGVIVFSKAMKTADKVLKELAKREVPNRQKCLSTIIFMEHTLSTGTRVSGYIDYESSLRRFNTNEPGATNWKMVFEGKVKLVPKKIHLSYYSWLTGKVFINNSLNFIVSQDPALGLVFQHKGDHKVITVDAKTAPDNASFTRHLIFSKRYGHVILYDHIVRKIV